MEIVKFKNGNYGIRKRNYGKGFLNEGRIFYIENFINGENHLILFS
jgi:hypothetical protein